MINIFEKKGKKQVFNVKLATSSKYVVSVLFIFKLVHKLICGSVQIWI